MPRTARPVPQQWHVYTVDLGQHAGTRPGNRRPCIAVQPTPFAEGGLQSTVVVPLTTQLLDDAAPLRVRIPAGTAGLRNASDAMIDQIFACGNAFVREEIGVLPEGAREAVRGALREFLDLG